MQSILKNKKFVSIVLLGLIGLIATAGYLFTKKDQNNVATADETTIATATNSVDKADGKIDQNWISVPKEFDTYDEANNYGLDILKNQDVPIYDVLLVTNSLQNVDKYTVHFKIANPEESGNEAK